MIAAGCNRDTHFIPPAVPPGISYASMLLDATDLQKLALPVEYTASSRMFSSCKDPKKVMLASLAPQILGDMDHGFFTEVMDDKDGVRATLGDFDGPGAVTWVWSANPVGTIGLFIDELEKPALKMSFEDFLGGCFLPVHEPFASVTSLGHNLHFPIIHAKRCKLVLWVPRRENLAELFYQVAWQSLPTNTVIHPFDVAAIGRDQPLLKKLARRLTMASASDHPLSVDGTTTRTTEYALGAGQKAELFRTTGAAAITAIRLIGNSKADLGNLWVDGFWDGAADIHVPLHMLAGSSSGVEDTESLPATVDGHRVTLRWFMPFSNEGRLILSNAAHQACTVKVDVWTTPITASQYPLRFHANYLENNGLQTDGNNILTLAEVSGAGRFVGCVLGVDSRSDVWWGEGNHLIWLDDSSCPAWEGTGTEDYFGFAWCSQGIFDHPFRGQTHIAGDRSRRIAHMHRYHILDQLPFKQWGRFQFQAWGLGKGEMDWATTIMWYSIDKNAPQ